MGLTVSLEREVRPKGTSPKVPHGHALRRDSLPSARTPAWSSRLSAPASCRALADVLFDAAAGRRCTILDREPRRRTNASQEVTPGNANSSRNVRSP
eukprot:CAMPEP_0202086600 /NCGR_PEP_ID=MMETSP0964-20121228/34069_1 /ASSEMBLY_ACC=CAM_ASM_000500 /TAXON_ID=4773 /ORGANISM="Schizochytrium aggregatum, Strain ATCC28209" /LENGTH=96 /DNA_ID=CAMNT_0048654507 /DNA_START=148 /DNA_END=434 /DNA_ORIENTATION=-